MEQIKETLKIVMRDLAGEKKLFVPDSREECLKKALTKKELGHIRINYFKKGILGLYVDSSSWLYMLSIKKEELLKNLKKLSGNIKDIHFSIGDVK